MLSQRDGMQHNKHITGTLITDLKKLDSVELMLTISNCVDEVLTSHCMCFYQFCNSSDSMRLSLVASNCKKCTHFCRITLLLAQLPEPVYPM